MDPRLIGIGGQIVGGFLLGQQQREQRMQENEMKQKQIDQMLKMAQAREKREERLFEKQMSEKNASAPLMQAVLSKYGIGVQQAESGDGGTGLKYGETFGKDSSAAEAASAPKGPDIAGLMSDPLALALLKHGTGVDWLGAGTAYRQQITENRHANEFLYKMLNDERQLKARAGEVDYVERDVGGGVKERVPVFKNPRLAAQFNGGGGGGLGAVPPQLGGGAGLGSVPPTMGGGGGLRSSAGAENQPLGEGDRDNWIKIDPKTGSIERPDFSKYTSLKSLSDAGFKYATRDQQVAMYDFGSVDTILSKIESLMESAGIPKDESAAKRLVAGPGRKVQSVLQTNKYLTELERIVQGTLAPMIRNLGEKGTLANQDVERAFGLMPKITDRGAIAWDMVKNLRGVMTDARNRRLGTLMKNDQSRDKQLEGILFGK